MSTTATQTVTAHTDVDALIGGTFVATRTVRGHSYASTVRIVSAAHSPLGQVSALVVEVETGHSTGMALEYGDARLTPAPERCAQHPAFEPDNCPRCGTSAVIPVPAPAAGFYDQRGIWIGQA